MKQATTLLRLGIRGGRRPVDDLIDRLDEEDGGMWLVPALVSGPFRTESHPVLVLVHGQGTVEDLTRIKTRSKVLLRVEERDARLSGLAGYFLTIAAGLKHHDTLIGGRGRNELDPLLLDLAEAAPPPFSELLSEATLA